MESSNFIVQRTGMKHSDNRTMRVHLISYLLFDKYSQCTCQTSVYCQTLYLIIFVILNSLLLYMIFGCLHPLLCKAKGDVFHG